MAKVRILVVDDEVVARRLVSETLCADPELEIVGGAPDGRQGLALIEELRPDVVVLDVEMPQMNGLETRREIRRRWPDLAVIMFSALTAQGAQATLEALALGANDYVAKPKAAGGVEATRATINASLLPKVKFFGGRRDETRAPVPARPAPARPQSRLEVVAVGVSTGGPNALAVLIPALPRDLPVPVLVVQHMPPVFTRYLAERLAGQSALEVKEAEEGEPVLPGCVYLAPGDHHLTLARESGLIKVRTNQDPPENSCRPAVDVTFRSVAAVYGRAALAVVLTGMGQDGKLGSEAIRAKGGQILAQDRESSVVWGMPGAVAKSGLADQILPLKEIAGEIARRARALR